MTEAPFEALAQQELKAPESLFAEHNKERVWRSASVSSLFTQGMVKVRERTRRMKERKDMEMKWKREKRIPEKSYGNYKWQKGSVFWKNNSVIPNHFWEIKKTMCETQNKQTMTADLK